MESMRIEWCSREAVAPALQELETWWRVERFGGWPGRCLFVSPPWLLAWWESFGDGQEAGVLTAHRGERLVGYAPLLLSGGEARLMGDPEVCDVLDFAGDPHELDDFFPRVLERLQEIGIDRLNLGPLRPDSLACRHLLPLLETAGAAFSLAEEDESYELTLPSAWEDYLQRLSGKQRHEVRRKLRRLREAGRLDFEMVADPAAVAELVPVFLDLFRNSRADKAAFMTGPMTGFFQRLALRLGAIGWLRLGRLTLDGVVAALVWCFDDGDAVYLYNNGYDPRYREIHVGLASKLLSLRDAIARGRSRYDFLKGNEPYKQRLGAERVPILRCRAQLASKS